MAVPIKAFVFERDFSPKPSHPVAGDEGEAISAAELAEKLEQTRMLAYLEGEAAGQTAQRQSDAHKQAETLAFIAESLARHAARLETIEQETKAEAASLALVFARKLAGKLLDAHPIAPIEEAFCALLPDLLNVTQIAARVNPQQVDAVKTQLEALLAENGLACKVFVFPDPELERAECQIEWADGGILHHHSRIEQALEEAVHQAFAPPTPLVS